MKLITTALLSMSLLCLSGNAMAEGGFSDSGIDGPRYSKISSDLDALSSDYSDWSSIINYGESVNGKTLKMIKIGKPSLGPIMSQRPAILISGATHGNEYLHIADRLPEYFLTSKDTAPGLKRYLEAGGIIFVVPILNPDGYDADRRSNSNGVDLNRDFALLPAREPNFEQPETSQLTSALDDEITGDDLKLEVTVDYHCCDGSLLFPWSYTRASLPSVDLARHRDVALLMQDHISRNYEYGTTGQVLGYYPRGTSKDYYYAKYGARAYTFEGSRAREDKLFDRHQLWWDSVFDLVLEDY